MQIRCSSCTKTIAIGRAGALPANCPHCAQTAVPATLGAYRLDRLLATGGMGEVYLAHHEELGTEVAIKLLPAMPLDALPSVRQRFAREARLTTKVAHRGVVRVLSSDACADRPYLVLELVTGCTLRDLLQDGAMAKERAARIVAATADVLAAAHQQGVLHRDIKPDNVMLEPDATVRVLDFGIARAIADDTPLTRTGELVGTPEYMAPEQLLEGPEGTDARTDVHALGVLLYELLTGQSPFRGANLFQSLKLVESLVPKPASNDGAINAVVMRALAKQPDDRYPTAAEFAQALRTAVPAIDATPTLAPRSKQLVWLASAAVLFGIGALVAAALLLSWAFEAGKAAQTEITSALPEPTATSGAATSDAATSNELAVQMADGQWCRALIASERAARAGNPEARGVAQTAFVLAHAAWLQAAGLPAWLAACDLGQRSRLLGDLLEPGDGSTALLRALLCGDEQAWQAFGSTPASSSASSGASSIASNGLAKQLLAVTDVPIAERSQLLLAIATRLPIEQPEHWLARMLERHCQNDLAGAEQAAEMAWLCGAGETAVLIDAALAMRTADAQQRQRLWRRLAKSDREDCPASTLLLLWLEAAGIAGVDFEPNVAQNFPLPHRASASEWFVAAAANAASEQRVRCLRIAVALGATPDAQQEPWRSLPAARQSQLRAEAKRVK